MEENCKFFANIIISASPIFYCSYFKSKSARISNQNRQPEQQSRYRRAEEHETEEVEKTKIPLKIPHTKTATGPLSNSNQEGESKKSRLSPKIN